MPLRDDDLGVTIGVAGRAEPANSASVVVPEMNPRTPAGVTPLYRKTGSPGLTAAWPTFFTATITSSFWRETDPAQPLLNFESTLPIW